MNIIRSVAKGSSKLFTKGRLRVMAMNINTNGTEYKRGELFTVDPDSIIVDHGLNARAGKLQREKIWEMAESIALHGQRQPIEVRRVKDKRIQVVSGYTRIEAIRLINNTDELLKMAGGAKIGVQCRVVDCNDTEAFIRSIVENNDRNETTCIDDAHNIRRLRETYGKTDADIARLYHKTPAWVSQIAALIRLPQNVQDRVQSGDLTAQAARALLDLEPEQQREILEQADQAVEGVSGGAGEAAGSEGENTGSAAENASEASADGKEGKPEGKPEGKAAAKAKKSRKKSAIVTDAAKEAKRASGKKQSRGIKDVRELFEGLTGPAESVLVRVVSDVVLEFLSGKRGRESTEKKLREVTEGLEEKIGKTARDRIAEKYGVKQGK